MATGPRLLVNGPARTPLPFGLFATTQTADDPDPHWGNGISYQPDACDEAGVTSDPCPTPPADLAPTSDGLPSVCADSITVYSWVDCNPIGSWGDDGERYRQVAIAALEHGEARAIEREFWTGAHGYNPHLAEDAAVLDGDCVVQTAATIVTGGTSLKRAISELEGAIAECCGSYGVIHLPWRVVTNAGGDGVLEVKAGKLFTLAGTPIVAGAGYPGTSPAGAAPAANTVWLYGTGPIIARRSAIKITEPGASIDRDTNASVLIAERAYSLAFDTCHFASLATL